MSNDKATERAERCLAAVRESTADALPCPFGIVHTPCCLCDGTGFMTKDELVQHYELDLYALSK